MILFTYRSIRVGRFTDITIIIQAFDLNCGAVGGNKLHIVHYATVAPNSNQPINIRRLRKRFHMRPNKIIQHCSCNNISKHGYLISKIHPEKIGVAMQILLIGIGFNMQCGFVVVFHNPKRKRTHFVYFEVKANISHNHRDIAVM